MKKMVESFVVGYWLQKLSDLSYGRDEILAARFNEAIPPNFQ
jgi:hypothetical protein